jgi:hypothetical protein
VDLRSSLAAVERENALLTSELAAVVSTVSSVREWQESEGSQVSRLSRACQYLGAKSNHLIRFLRASNYIVGAVKHSMSRTATTSEIRRKTSDSTFHS